MDTLYWNNTNPVVKYEETTKMFYGKYLWKMCIEVTGGRLLQAKTEDLWKALADRKQIDRQYNWGGSWVFKRGNLENVNVPFLQEVKDAMLKWDKVVKFRIEEPWMQIYAEDERTLKLIAESFSPDNKVYITSVTGPANESTIELLKAGSIIKRKDNEYRYKVVLRDGRYDVEVKHRILNYLESLGDLVKLSKGSKEMLSKSYNSMWNVFFYTNDPKIVTFLSLISPRLVSNIHELVNPDE